MEICNTPRHARTFDTGNIAEGRIGGRELAMGFENDVEDKDISNLGEFVYREMRGGDEKTGGGGSVLLSQIGDAVDNGVVGGEIGLDDLFGDISW